MLVIIGFVVFCCLLACLLVLAIGSCAIAAVNKSDKKYDRRRRIRRLVAKGVIDKDEFEEEYWDDVTDEELDELEEDQ